MSKKQKPPRRKKIPIEQVVQKIRENENCVFVQDVYELLDICRPTFYLWYKTDSPERLLIDEALETNRTKTKKIIRNRLLESKNTAALLALYRLIATPEERNILNQYKVEELEAKKSDNTIELVVS